MILLAMLLFCSLVLPGSAAAQTGLIQPNVITLSPTNVKISPSLYGINYVWDKIPGDTFSQFQALIARVTHYTFARFPGGWNGERLNWGQNLELEQAPPAPGVDVGTFLASVPAATFIVPSKKAIAHPETADAIAQQSAQLVAQYGKNVTVWEIGNEWWLQNGAQKSAAKLAYNLQNYANYLSLVVPAMKAVDPNIQIYVSADWQHPEQFATLRQLTSPSAWSEVSGISVHTYCGNDDPSRLCSLLPQRISQARAMAGKDLVYDSEWAVPAAQSQNDFGIQNAIYTMTAFQDLADAGVQMAAYWPPVKNVPGMALIAADYSDGYATGYLFGWLRQGYEGTAMLANGNLPAIAARNGGQVTVFVAAPSQSPCPISIDLAGTGLHQVVSADVMFAAAPQDAKSEDSRKVTIVALPVTITAAANGSSYAELTLNPGTANRGGSDEIARVTLQ
jgi:hypothetical protein